MSTKPGDHSRFCARQLLVTCEHGGNEIPAAYASHFVDHRGLLDSHRGWDPGALELARRMASAFDAPLFASTTSRLLVDLNRSVGHKRLHSEATRPLPRAVRRAIVQAHYQPHRENVIDAVKGRVAQGLRVVHVASHSFTPELGGVVRAADVAWLYDPRRPGEAALSATWMAALKRRMPALRLRRNYPYHGKEDGLTSSLRRQFSDDEYLGVELEVNQRFVLEHDPAWEPLQLAITQALRDAMEQHARGDPR